MIFFASCVYPWKFDLKTNVALITSIITISVMFVVDEYETTTEVKNYHQQSTIAANSMILLRNDVKHILPGSLI